LGGHKWWLTTVFEVTAPIATFLFFEVALQKTLPKGFTDPLFEPIYAFIYS
jgi:putative tricarboxylic transport membrane protein